MFQLDDNFLNDLGLQDLPDEQKKIFLQTVYDQLEERVGMRLAEGLSDSQLQEFESLIDAADPAMVSDWLSQNAPDYATQPDFQRLQAQATEVGATDAAVASEYAATKWLEINRPDYRNVVAEVLEDLKKEIASNREGILGNAA